MWLAPDEAKQIRDGIKGSPKTARQGEMLCLSSCPLGMRTQFSRGADISVNVITGTVTYHLLFSKPEPSLFTLLLSPHS